MYFDSLAVFVSLMLTGRFWQARVLARNRHFLLEDDGLADFFAAAKWLQAKGAQATGARVRWKPLASGTSLPEMS